MKPILPCLVVVVHFSVLRPATRLAAAQDCERARNSPPENGLDYLAKLNNKIWVT